jgi:hypothetical protein
LAEGGPLGGGCGWGVGAGDDDEKESQPGNHVFFFQCWWCTATWLHIAFTSLHSASAKFSQRHIESYRHSALTLVWSTSHVGDFNQNLG